MIKRRPTSRLGESIMSLPCTAGMVKDKFLTTECN